MLVPAALARAQVSLNARVEMSFRRVHLVLLPEVLLEALDPLEVGDDHAAGVREHVREDEHAPVLEDLVGGGRRRAVRALADDLGLDLVRVVRRDHLLERARREHVALEQEQLLVRDRLRVRSARQRAGLLLVRDRGLDVDPVRVVDAAGESGDCDHRCALLREELREVAADVAEALDGDALPRDRQPSLRIASRMQ